MNHLGTKGILDDIQKETLLRQLIVEYDNEYNSKTKVKYKDIFEFVKLKFQSNEIDFYPGYTWWKTKGKYLVDEYNTLSKTTITISETIDIDVFDIFEVIEKYYKDKEELIKYLSPYKLILDRLIEKLNKTQSLSEKLTAQIEEKDEQINLLEKKYLDQQKLLNGLFYNLTSSESDLVKVMGSLNDTNSEVVNYALTQTFTNPAEYIEEFGNQINTIKQVEIEKDNVVKFQQRKGKLNNEEYDY